MHIFKTPPGQDLAPVSATGRQLECVPDGVKGSDFSIVAAGLLRQLDWLIIEAVREARAVADLKAARRFCELRPYAITQRQKDDLLRFLFGHTEGPRGYRRIPRIPWSIEQIDVSHHRNTN